MCNIDKPVTCFDTAKRKHRIKKYCRACCKSISRSVQRRNAKLRSEFGSAKNSKGNTYDGRDKHLRLIGYSSYRDYLNSDLWKNIRERVFAIKGNDCYLCGTRATELHHNRYHKNDLTGKKIKYINPICRSCHANIEFQESGKKSTVLEAKKSFDKARKKVRKSTDWTVMPFGKHKGLRVDSIPLDYLVWLKANVDLKGYLLDSVDRALERKLESHTKVAPKKASPKPKRKKKRTGSSHLHPSQTLEDIKQTHYEYTMPTGEKTMIPNSISMDGRENELCPF